jgi:hypothetical protein
MDRLEGGTMFEALLPTLIQRTSSLLSPHRVLTAAVSRASQPWSAAAEAVASLSAAAYFAGDAVQKLLPLLHEQLLNSGALPKKGQDLGSRVPMEIRSLDGNDYRIMMVSPALNTIWQFGIVLVGLLKSRLVSPE